MLIRAWRRASRAPSRDRAFATPGRPAPGRSLLGWIRPVAHAAVPRDVVEHILASVAVYDRLKPDDTADGLDLEGGWRQGVLYGRNPEEEVRFVGETARQRE